MVTRWDRSSYQLLLLSAPQPQSAGEDARVEVETGGQHPQPRLGGPGQLLLLQLPTGDLNLPRRYKTACQKIPLGPGCRISATWLGLMRLNCAREVVGWQPM